MEGRHVNVPTASAAPAAATVKPITCPAPKLDPTSMVMSPAIAGSPATVRATDAEVSVRATCPADVAEAGECLIPALRLRRLLLEMDAHPVLTVGKTPGEGPVLTAGACRFAFYDLDPGVFPDWPECPEAEGLSLPADRLALALDRTAFAAAKDKDGYSMSGVLLEMRPDALNVVATDSLRFARAKVRPTTPGVTVTLPPHVAPLLPPKAASAFLRLLRDEGDAPVRLVLTDRSAVLLTSTGACHALLINGKFPLWRDLFRRPPEGVSAACAAGPLLHAVRQVAVMRDENLTPRIRLTLGVNKLTVRAVAKGSKAVASLDVACSGEVETQLNPALLIPFLSKLAPESEVRWLTPPEKSGYLTWRTDDDYSYLLMPLQEPRVEPPPPVPALQPEPAAV